MVRLMTHQYRFTDGQHPEEDFAGLVKKRVLQALEHRQKIYCQTQSSLPSPVQRR